MSSNLLKGRYMTLKPDEKRVIDTNELVAKRIEELSVKMKRPENEGFVAGLNAREMEVDVDALLADDEGELTQGNVMKAGEDAENILARAGQEAEAILESARAEAERITSEAKTAAEAETAKVLAQAREQGYTEGLQKADREAENQRRHLAEKEQQLQEDYLRQLDELEPQFIDTLTGIYEHIFQVELSSYREILVYLISSTMRKIEGTRSFLIHVSEEDYPYVTMEKKQFMTNAAAPDSVVEVIEDITLSKNECMIETESGIFDCGLGTQLSELTQKLRLLSYERKVEN